MCVCVGGVCVRAQAHELMECCMLPSPCKYMCGAQPPFIKLMEHEAQCSRRYTLALIPSLWP